MGSAIRTRLIPAVMLLVIVLAIWWARRKPPETYSVAYVNDRSAILWSTTAQVRQRVADLKYGEKVDVLGHTGDETEVRGGDGTQGWVETQLLMSPDLWQHASDLLAHARSMPVQASGHTRAVSNVHMEPSRTATRVFQFGRNVSVVVLDRKVAAVPAAAPTAAPAPNAPASTAAGGAPEGDASESEGEQAKQEDWLLVLHVAQQSGGAADAATGSVSAAPRTGNGGDGGTDGEDIPIAGWVLARFIELDPPAPIGDYATSAALRVVAWFVLNKVPGDGERPQYLVAGSRGGEGQPCDFTSLRVYTWGAARQRYETAYVENDLCGQFPIRTMEEPDGAEFRFAELDENDALRVYRMKQTIVRRVRENQASANNKR
jgi:hypothetical protein